uniref:Putative product n=1 Tax=Xenopsylla cheopis TaxID=163159 RepID=A0A6M2DY11_XENCH
MLFLRITPLLPNWFINLVAPVVGVPLFPFAFGTLFGVMPPSILAIQAGKTLNNLTSTSTLSWNSVLVLGGLAVGSLVPVLLRNKLKKKFE